MSNSPKVSIIIPVYNVEKYVARCLDSLVNQTLAEIEIICVDDQSPDNSFEVMRHYQEKYPEKVIIVRSDINRCIGGARNLGLARASGEYVGFVDSDDWVDPTMFEKLYSCAIQSQCDVVDCDYCIMAADQTIGRVSNTPDQVGELDIARKKSLVLNPGRVWTKIYRRSFLQENHLIFPEHLFYEENEFMPITMVHAQKLGKVNEKLYFYFAGSSLSTTKKRNSRHHLDRLQTSINMREHFIERNVYEIYKDEIDFRFIQLYYRTTISMCLNKFDKPQTEYLFQLRNYMRDHFKNYRSNPYYRKNISRHADIVTILNDYNPYLAVAYHYVVESPRKELIKFYRKYLKRKKSEMINSDSLVI
jgi:glycosyltransferase involved in cell wall biosynthesis